MDTPFHLRPFDEVEPVDAPLDLGPYEDAEADWLRDMPVPSGADLAFGGLLVIIVLAWLAGVVATILHQMGRL